MNSCEENIRRFGQPVTGRGSTWPKDRELISLSFNTQGGETLRIQMQKEEAHWLLQTLNHYLDVNIDSASEKLSVHAILPKTDAAQQTELAWLTPDLDWPNDGVANIPKTPDDPRAILRDMIDQGLVDSIIGGYLHVMLEAYRRGVIKL